MDDLDKKLLNMLQTDFPLVSRPYRLIAEKLGIPESSVLSRVQQLMKDGVIRKISPVFDARCLGYATTLVAMKVPETRLDEVAGLVNSYPQVTHNYGREHKYNLWFTLVCRDSHEIERLLQDIRERTGVSEIHSLPAKRVFKIRVRFEFR